MIREWLTVLLRRDLGLVVMMGVPGREPTRASINRFATWWVVLERHGEMVRLYPAGTASNESSASELVVGQIERLCGVAEAAPLRPITLDTEQLLNSVRDTASLRAFLLEQRLDADQLQVVLTAADPARSAHANIVALQAGVGPDELARVAVGDATVSIVDTPGAACASKASSRGSAATRFFRPARAATSAERCNGSSAGCPPATSGTRIGGWCDGVIGCRSNLVNQSLVITTPVALDGWFLNG